MIRVFERFGPHTYHRVTMQQMDGPLSLKIAVKINNQDTYSEWDMPNFEGWSILDVEDQLSMQGYKERA